ncbi:hypothetical protein GALL_501400 [mine drainage metagenome]|uniref:Uncharacterized protein n=1 Tax=mine drainage metagenome TaxID=410659 RepID=A0A1J5PXC6_9ZZZZ
MATADDEGQVAVFGVVAFFDARVEGVAVQMGDGEGVQLRMGHDPWGSAGGAAALELTALIAVAAEGFHAVPSRGHSQAAPLTPEESPWAALRTGVVKQSVKT